MALILTGASGSTTLDSSAGLTFSDSSNQQYAAGPYVLKNRIINGAMVIDQRNAGASVTPSGTGFYTLDRWQANMVSASKFSVQQNAGSVTPPAGFTNYLGVTSLFATTVGTSDYYYITQTIEGYNVADFAFGTANAKTITLSFWVRSSLTGTFGGALRNSAQNRSYPFTYTISSANTWTQISITISGDTTGTWLTTNGLGMDVNFSLGMGSTYSGTAGAWAGTNYASSTGAVNMISTNGATFYITGVQLEIGSTATPFERRLYNQELANCQRYYYRINSTGSYGLMGWGQGYSTTSVRIDIPLPVTMRVVATGFDYSSTSTYLLVGGAGVAPTISSVGTSTNNSLQNAQLQITTSTAAVSGVFYDLFANGASAAYVGVIAEL